jgi:hypothetical protein
MDRQYSHSQKENNMTRAAANKPQSSGGVRQAIRPAAAKKGVVQRAIGLEIESDLSWQAYDRHKQLITGRHEILMSKEGFRLENELSGKLEFVIEPAVDTAEQLVAIVKNIQAVVYEMQNAKVEPAIVRDDFAVEYYSKVHNKSKEEILKDKQFDTNVNKKVNLIRTNQISGSNSTTYISKGYAFPGGFQATVGVHMAAIPELLKWIKTTGLFSMTSFPTKDIMEKAEQKVGTARESSIGIPFNWYNQISPEMEGLLHLIFYYLLVGTSVRDRRPFPKGLTQVMARTNFAEMFAMTPEAGFLSRNRDYWVKFVTKAARLDPDGRIFESKFGDTDKDAKTVDLTRAQWLSSMVGTSGEKGVDKLTIAGGGPAILKTMGGMTKTDSLGVDSPGDRGVILELRGLDGASVGVDDWGRFAKFIADSINDINRLTSPQERMAKNQEVAGEGHGSELFWSPLPQQEKAGKNVYAMAVEVFSTRFQAQANQYVDKARSQAKVAFTLDS